jgi:hypothetical protein
MGTYEVEEEDLLFLHAVVHEDLDRLHSGTTGR